MNRIKELAKREGRTLTWLAARLEMDRRKFDVYISRNSFTPEQRVMIAELLSSAVTDVFPEPALTEVQR